MAFTKIFKIPELRKKLLFTAALLAVYRAGIFVSTPGVDRRALGEAFNQSAGTLFGVFNMFSGGAFKQASIFALGIMPYISSSIIMQLMQVVIPTLERWQKEGEQGRRRITQYTRYGTIVLAVVQGYGIAKFLASSPFGTQVVDDPSWRFYAITILTLTCGTVFVMWLGEQITERGIGNGISLIIAGGIVAQLPSALRDTWSYAKQDLLSPVQLMLLVAVVLAVIAAITYVEQAQRRIPIQYAKRMVGGTAVGGQSSHLPLKINQASVMPPIFASAFLTIPSTLASVQMFSNSDVLSLLQSFLRQDSWLFNIVFVTLIIFFAFFYTAVVFNPNDVADNIKKQGGFIPGIRPGRSTAEHIDRIVSRLTFGGAIYLCAVCVLPTILITNLSVPFMFGGTGLLIVVGVALDTVKQIESHLITQQYEGFTTAKGAKIRGRVSGSIA